MLRKLLFTCFVIFTGNFLFAQDTIHMINREKVIAKVQEINPAQIKYKLFSFQDGPTYVVNKTEVWKIVYSDGHSEYFQDDEEEEITLVRPVLVGLNSFDLMFGFISVNGEYYFAKRAISIKIPVSIGLAGVKGAADGNSYNQSYYYYNQMKIVSVGAQLLFYPGHLKHRVNYFTGLSFEYGRMLSRYSYYTGYPYYNQSGRATNDWFGTGIISGVQIELADRLSLGLSTTLGMQVVYQTYQVNYVGVTDVDTTPLGRLDFTIGFRLGKIKHDIKP